MSDNDEQKDNEKTKHTETPEMVVNFEEKLKTTDPLKNDVSANETLQLFRESYTVVAKTLEKIDSLLNQINDREESMAKKLRSQGKPITDSDGSLWYRTVLNSLTHAQLDATGEAALARDDSFWAQEVDVDGKMLRAGQPKQNINSGNFTSQERVMYLTKKSGIGTVFDVPLYHSGIWIRLSTPPLFALSALQHQISQLKVSLGSDTKGMAFSNTAQSITMAAVDFALQYVVESSVNYSTASDLKDKIKVLDIQALLWGLAVTIYPKGYPYSHPCIADPTKCQHVIKEHLNLNRLFWTDRVSLSNYQRKIMARRFDVKVTDAELTQYHAESVRGNDTLVWFDDIGVTLKIPTVDEYDKSGRQWIDGIIEMTSGAFNEPPHGANRDNYITRLGISTTARQYTHWVKSIHERDEENGDQLIGDDEETINLTLDHVFSSDEYSERFFEEINKYKDNSIISLVAIPSFDCPNCGSPISTEFNERLPHLVPIDVVTTFFTLVNRKHK